MRKPVSIIMAVGAVAAATGALVTGGQTKGAAMPRAFWADAAHPALVELYQSQGCSSCPPALATLASEADRPDVIALSFAVTYWDQLGWKDRFAKQEFTGRQWDYARAGGRAQVATPQLIVNGRGAVNGSNRAEFESALARWDRGRTGPELKAQGSTLSVGASRAATPATVWLVAYDPRTIAVPIRAGENGGRTLPHRNIVRALTALGRWTGKMVTLSLPPAQTGLNRAVFVQAGVGGPIVAAIRI